MKPEIKAKWVQALRSGEYKQGNFYLRRNDEFCCLGVLCDIALKDGLTLEVKKDPDNGVYHYNESSGLLPHIVLQWSGLDIRNPKIDEEMNLVVLNDDSKMGFSQIADKIEKQL